MHHLEESLQDADACVKLCPDWAKAHARRGAALNALCRLHEAATAYERCLQLDPNHEIASAELHSIQVRLCVCV